MKGLTCLALFVLVLATTVAQAGTMTLNVDSAPNVYGSSDWAPWWTAAKTDVVDGTFTNMRTGTYPGTTTMDPLDEIVYSTGDLGKRLHWIYWVPGQTTALLDGLFEVKWVIDWGGSEWILEGGGWAADGASVGWEQPTNWEDYTGTTGTTGVIGSLGFAWWATDNDALPYSTGGDDDDETDAADIAALRDDVFLAQTHATGYVRMRDNVNSDWQVSSLRVDIVHPVPVPQAAWLGLVMMVGLAGYRRMRRRS